MPLRIWTRAVGRRVVPAAFHGHELVMEIDLNAYGVFSSSSHFWFLALRRMLPTDFRDQASQCALDCQNPLEPKRRLVQAHAG